MIKKSKTTSLRIKINSRLKNAMEADRRVIAKELASIKKTEESSDEEKILKRFHDLERRLYNSIKKRRLRRAHLPEITYPDQLPITSRKDEIVEAIKKHQVLVITGETGSGKTTQIPKMCIEAGRGIDGVIGCTQPRRIAATSVSRRIASELKEEIGRSVGYKIRFEDTTNRDIHIKFMTDGILLMEAQNDPYLTEYDTLIIDEAHERSINIDFALGIIKTLIKKRRDLKLIITSATIDPEKFSAAFDNAPIIEVSGRMYPVETRYEPFDPESDICAEAAEKAVSRLKKERKPGDILIFMPTEQDIRETCDIITAKKYVNTKVMPMFAQLSSADQQKIFSRTKEQKIIVATNIAETSITIPDIRYVVDTGLARISEYSPSTRTKRLPIKPVSKSSADQRKGRCGRVQNGICVRLYDEEDYKNRPLFTSPEILRSNLAEIILRMIALKIGDIQSFPFIDPPDKRNIKDGIKMLRELGAIREEKGKGGEGLSLTEKGKIMARLPLDPRISRMTIEALEQNCLNEVAVIAAALSIQDPKERPAEMEKEADFMHKSFDNPSSDFIVLLNIWNRYHDMQATLKTRNKMRKFCKEHFLSCRRMREWEDINDQILTILKEEGISQNSKKSPIGELLYEAIHKSILSGYISNIAVKKEKNIYLSARNREMMVFPGSAIFNRAGDWIVAADIIETSRLFARTTAMIKSEWLEEYGGDMCRSTYSEPHWEKGHEEVVAFEQVTLYGLVIVRGRRVSYGKINPEESTCIFIREALIEGNIRRPLSFMVYNLKLIEGITDMEDKLRRRDLLVSEDILSDFYKQRLGTVYDLRTLKKIIKDRGNDDFLRMKREDILRYHPEEELALYPNDIVLKNRRIRCSYSFNPGNQKDGVTVKVLSGIASEISPESAECRIPGLLKEKISFLIRGLPGKFRKKLVPIPQTVEIILRDMEIAEDSLLSTMASFIHKRFGVSIPATAWPADTLPEHLKIRFSVVDEQGRELKAGRDINQLRESTAERADSPAFGKARKAWEKADLTEWNFGDLPETVRVETKGKPENFAFPALEDADGKINLRLFEDKNEALKSHEKGVTALYEILFRKELKFLEKCLALEGETKKYADWAGGLQHIEDALYRKTVKTLFCKNIRKQEEFFRYAKSSKSEILITGQRILEEIKPVLKECYDTGSMLYDLESSNRFNKSITDFAAGLRKEINRLVPKNFPEIYDSERLSHIPRYLKAIKIRAQRGSVFLSKDKSKEEKLKVFTDYMEKLSADMPSYSSEEKKNALAAYSWMIEEYKISLFAPELKTPFPVSRKRLEEKIREIERMI